MATGPPFAQASLATVRVEGGNLHIMTEQPGGQVLKVPLLMANIRKAELATGELVVVIKASRATASAISAAACLPEASFQSAPPASLVGDAGGLQPQLPEGAPCRSSGRRHPFRSTWLVMVKSRRHEAVQRVLAAMCANGAIRSDFFTSHGIFEERLGSGATAEVFAAAELAPGQEAVGDGGEDAPPPPLAAKVLTPPAARRSTLRREVEMLVAAQGHANVVRFHGLFWMGDDEPKTDLWCLVMERCMQGDLWSCVARSTFCESQARKVMRSLLGALAHIHARGILHRDVKGENVLMKDGGEPVLTDFGVACFLTDEAEMGKRVGTPGYAAPEMLTNQGYTQKADIFSTGVLLFFMLCGELPFRGADLMETLKSTVTDEICLEEQSMMKNTSDICKDFLRRLLQKHPAGRPAADAAARATWVTIGRCGGRNWRSILRRGGPGGPAQPNARGPLDSLDEADMWANVPPGGPQHRRRDDEDEDDSWLSVDGILGGAPRSVASVPQSFQSEGERNCYRSFAPAKPFEPEDFDQCFEWEKVGSEVGLQPLRVSARRESVGERRMSWGASSGNLSHLKGIALDVKLELGPITATGTLAPVV